MLRLRLGLVVPVVGGLSGVWRVSLILVGFRRFSMRGRGSCGCNDMAGVWRDVTVPFGLSIITGSCISAGVPNYRRALLHKDSALMSIRSRLALLVTCDEIVRLL